MSVPSEDFHSGVIRGTCMNMCPSDELLLREREGLLHILETKYGTEAHRRPTADPSRTVKAYTRSAAGTDVADCLHLRPLDVLQQTVDYLMECACQTEDIPWYEVYNFVFDRQRAVRQDLVIQRLEGLTSINILQKILAFLVYSNYRLCTEPLGKYDPGLNHQDCEVVFQRLFIMLDSLQESYTRQVDIECLCLLYNLGNTNVLSRYYQLPHRIRKNKHVELCYNINIAYMLGNYVKFFRLVKCLPSTLYLCAIHRNITDVRRYAATHTTVWPLWMEQIPRMGILPTELIPGQFTMKPSRNAINEAPGFVFEKYIQLIRNALRVMSAGYNSKVLKYPLRKFMDISLFNSKNETVQNCQSHGITVSNEHACFIKADFKHPEKEVHSHWYLIEDRLRSDYLSNVIGGYDLEMDFTQHCNIER